MGFLTAVAQTTAPPTPSGMPSAPPPDTVLVTGLPSVIEYRRTFLPIFHEDAPLCVDFTVRSVEETSSLLRITSSGMGGARLLDLSGLSTKSDCAASATNSTTTIILTNVGDQERAIRLILPSGAFPDASDGATGKLLLLRAGKPVTEVGLALRREDYAPFAKAFLWFWGVATPAIVAAIIGIFVYRYQKSADAKASEDFALDRFRKDRAEDLKTFFEGLYQTAVKLEEDSDYQSTMERELVAKGILLALSGKARERVIAALRKYDRAAVSDELAKAFPDNEQAILKSKRAKE